MLVYETIADAMRAQLHAAGVAGGNVERDRNEPTQDDALPWANVVVGADIARPDGDARTGIPTFIHTVTVSVVVYDKGASGLDLRGNLAAHAEAVLTSLLSDLAWWGGYVEGIGALRQIYESPPDGNYIAGRVQVQLDLLLRSSWAPALPAANFATLSAGVATPSGTPQPGITIAVPTA